MNYKGVDVDTKCEWILSRLQNTDGWTYRATLEDEMLSYDKFTISKFRTAVGKIETLNFVELDTEPTEGAINDKKIYKIDSSVVNAYLEAKGKVGLEQRLSSPSASDTNVGKIRDELQDERAERRQLESDVRELRSELELLRNHFNSRGSERIARIEENQDYLMDHADAVEQHLLAVRNILQSHDVDYDDYLELDF